MSAKPDLLIDLPKALVHFYLLPFLTLNEFGRVHTAYVSRHKRTLLDDAMKNSVVKILAVSDNHHAFKWISNRKILVTCVILGRGITEESMLALADSQHVHVSKVRWGDWILPSREQKYDELIKILKLLEATRIKIHESDVAQESNFKLAQIMKQRKELTILKLQGMVLSEATKRLLASENPTATSFYPVFLSSVNSYTKAVDEV